jgi:hypothetical protein
MPIHHRTTEERLAGLERSLARARLGILALGALLVGALAAGAARVSVPSDELRTRRLVVVDVEGRPRVILGQDRADADRISRAAGLFLYDVRGAERGGFSSFADGSVVLGRDAPHGVGDPMPDRIGLKVYATGAADVTLLDNSPRARARLSAKEGDGGLQVFSWKDDEVRVKTLAWEGERFESVPLGR